MNELPDPIALDGHRARWPRHGVPVDVMPDRKPRLPLARRGSAIGLARRFVPEVHGWGG